MSEKRTRLGIEGSRIMGLSYVDWQPITNSLVIHSLILNPLIPYYILLSQHP